MERRVRSTRAMPCVFASLTISWFRRWQLTLLRKAKRHRVEVKYIGQPACLTGKQVQPHQPPFIAVLSELKLVAAAA
jgi:hypothetical protein